MSSSRGLFVFVIPLGSTRRGMCRDVSRRDET